MPPNPIPVGLATKAGAVITALLGILAALAEFGVELDADTQAMLNRALVVAGLVLGGRYAQATVVNKELANPDADADVRVDAAFQRGVQAAKATGPIKFDTPEAAWPDDEWIAATEGVEDEVEVTPADQVPPDEGDNAAADRERVRPGAIDPPEAT